MFEKNYEPSTLVDNAIPMIYHYDVRQNSNLQINWHEAVEILYCTTGQCTVVCNGTEHDMQSGDVFVFNTNESHGVMTRRYGEYHCIIIGKDFLVENGLDVDRAEFETHIKSEKTAKYVRKLITAYQKESESRTFFVRTAMMELVSHLVKYHCEYQTSPKRYYGDEDIRLAIGYIKAHFTEHITLRDVAEQVGLDKYYFTRKFKKVTLMTFTEFLNTERCMNAKKLLKKKEYSVKEVARMCGFQNDSYFSKTFREIVGVLPSGV